MQCGETISVGKRDEFEDDVDVINLDEREVELAPKAKSTETPKGVKIPRKHPRRGRTSMHVS